MGRIMIVDDAEAVRLALRLLLLRHGFEVAAEAGNGEEALRLYRSVRPNVVIMDYSMPVMNGMEALKSLLALDPDAKVIMCSAVGDEDAVTQAMRIGACDFVTKPFDDDRVIRSIRDALRRPEL